MALYEKSGTAECIKSGRKYKSNTVLEFELGDLEVHDE
jgi:hypothetical protein